MASSWGGGNLIVDLLRFGPKEWQCRKVGLELDFHSMKMWVGFVVDYDYDYIFFKWKGSICSCQKGLQFKNKQTVHFFAWYFFISWYHFQINILAKALRSVRWAPWVQWVRSVAPVRSWPTSPRRHRHRPLFATLPHDHGEQKLTTNHNETQWCKLRSVMLGN